MNKILETRHLLTFATVVQTGSFTTAARKLYLSQSAISHQIKALEESIGAAVFERTGKPMRLTPAGQALHQRAVEILAKLEDARQAVAEAKGEARGQLRLGAAATVCEYLLPPVLREFRKQFPNYQLSVEPADTAPLVERLLADQIDFGIILLPIRNSSLKTMELFDDELVAVVPPKHPWAKQRTVPLDEVANQSFILYSRRSVTYQLLETFLRSKNLPIPSFIETGEADVIKAMVKMELGVGVVAPWIAERELKHKRLVAIPFAGSRLSRHWGIASRRGKRWPAAHRTFVGLCRNFLHPKQRWI